MSGHNKDNLLPPIRSLDDPRYIKLAEGRERYNQERKQKKERREAYARQLAEFKASSLEAAQERIESGDLPSPAELLMDMIKQQMIAINNPELTTSEANKEKSLLLQMQKQYAEMTGANAPNAQSVDVTTDDAESKTPEQISEELIKKTAKLRSVK